MKLILCGGGSGDQNTLANQKLNEIIDHNKPILYIPLAMNENEHPYDGCFEWINEELKSVDKTGISMVRSFEDLASRNLQDYSALFIGGGNTYKLLLGLKESGAFKNIRDYINKDGVVIGGSAGAVIFGYDINIIASMDPNDVNLEDTKGFDVLSGISIFPHYTNRKSKHTEEENNERMKMFTDSITKYSEKIGKVIAIPEEDAIYISEEGVQVIGTKPYFVFKNGVSEKINLFDCEQRLNKKL